MKFELTYTNGTKVIVSRQVAWGFPDLADPELRQLLDRKAKDQATAVAQAAEASRGSITAVKVV